MSVDFRQIAVAHYRQCVREDFVDAMCCWGASDSFQCHVKELANILNCDELRAADLLRPAYQDLWEAVKGAAGD